MPMSVGHDSPPLPPPWGHLPLSGGEIIAVRLGPRDLWVREYQGDIWLAHVEEPRPVGDPAESGFGTPEPLPPESALWSRWATPEEAGQLQLQPAFPDRPLVLSPERPFRLLSGATARVFVRVPLWIRLQLITPARPGSSLFLDELPSHGLSDTWWGDFVSGDLAYWLPTTARREMRPELFAAHLAVCPLVLENQALTDLRVEKLSLRVEHLSLFVRGSELWGDECRVRYMGDEEGSRIEMTGRAPAEAAGARLALPPRVPAVRGLRARTFARLMAFPGMGGGA
jgi:hypothetical protein